MDTNRTLFSRLGPRVLNRHPGFSTPPSSPMGPHLLRSEDSGLGRGREELQGAGKEEVGPGSLRVGACGEGIQGTHTLPVDMICKTVQKGLSTVHAHS